MSAWHKTYVMGLCLLLGTLANPAMSVAQSGGSQAAVPEQDLNGKIEKLTRSLEQTQTELARSRSEIEQLRTMLGEVLKRMDSGKAIASSEGNNLGGEFPSGPTEAPAPPAQISQDDWELLNARVE